MADKPKLKDTAKNLMYRAMRPGMADVSTSLQRVEAAVGSLATAIWRGGLDGAARNASGTEVLALTAKYHCELKFWDEFVRRIAREQFGTDFYSLYGSWQRTRMDELAECLGLNGREELSAWCAARTAVEIGAGPFPSICMERWRRAVAADPLADGYAVLGLLPPECDGVTYIATVGEFLPLTTGLADIVVAENCLDHVDNPRAVLSEVRRVLQPGGHFWLLVDLMTYSDAMHPHPFTEESLRSMLAEQGFAIVRDRVSDHKSHPNAFGEYRGLLRKL